MATVTTPLPSLAVPGQQLGPSISYTAGPGTHVQNSYVYASIVGPVLVDSISNTPAKSNPTSRPTLSVSRTYRKDSRKGGEEDGNPLMNGGSMATSTSTAGKQSTIPKENFNTLPTINSTVLARVTRVQTRQAAVSILVVLPSPSSPTPPSLSYTLTPTPPELTFQALIRKEDVRLVERDRIVMDEMFRVGDIIRGTVISLGDQSFYYLSTARNELGVVMARSEGGNMMFPVSWKEMRDPVTGVGEGRKVAKPF